MRELLGQLRNLLRELRNLWWRQRRRLHGPEAGRGFGKSAERGVLPPRPLTGHATDNSRKRPVLQVLPRLSARHAVFRVSATGNEVEIRGGARTTRALLPLLDGHLTVTEILHQLPRGLRRDAATLLDLMFRESITLDRDDQSRRLISEAFGRPKLEPAQLNEIATAPRYRAVEPGSASLRPINTPDTGIERRLIARSSWPVDWKARPMDLRAVAGVAQTVAAAATRTANESKPVASAGRLWPLSTWLLTSAGEGDYRVEWLDDEATAVAELGKVVADKLIACFIPTDWTQAAFSSGVAIIVFAADMTRISAKYGNRAALYVAIETGGVMQAAQLVADEIGALTRPVGGFFEKKLSEVLALPDELVPVLTMFVGVD